MKKILVLGATGAMGQYLIPELAAMNYQVTAVALDKKESPFPNVRYVQGNAMEMPFRKELLAEKYDAIVDFMIYPTALLTQYLFLMLDSTEHYIYFSSYRVYDGKEVPVRETSPLIIDSSDNVMLKNSDDYSIYKARGEAMLRASGKKNWTILRPAITYSYLRSQLVTLELPNTVGRARTNRIVLLPEQARKVQATMSWGGDAGRLIARLVLNEKALGEAFSVTTNEHHTWEEIAGYYREICDLRSVWIDEEDYLQILCLSPYNYAYRWQLEYDRMLPRVMDNSKICAATGIAPESFMKLYDGLSREISRIPADYPWKDNDADVRMDAYIREHHIS